MQCELVSSYSSLHGMFIYIYPTIYIVDHFDIDSTRALKYWSKECTAGVDPLLLIMEDENEACHWLMGP